MDIRVELGLGEDSCAASSHRIHQLCRFLLSPCAFLSQNLVLLFQCSTRDFPYKSMDAHTHILHSWTVYTQPGLISSKFVAPKPGVRLLPGEKGVEKSTPSAAEGSLDTELQGGV